MPRNDPIDIEFAVPFVHRLRFTDDVLGEDAEALADVLEPSGDGRARVQFWLDGHLAADRPDLEGRLEKFVGSRTSRLELAGPIERLEGGEAAKNDPAVLERILRAFCAADLDRRSYVVVIGGGAVLDAVGFAAAIAHRGIRLVRLPTTTLAQADSGVGVKNSLNFFRRKNWVGTFAVPWAVINDTALLATLPDREHLAGFSEAVKVSLLKNAQLFERMLRLAPRIRARDVAACGEVIAASARLHLDHITRGGDPFEVREARPLDFGHWSAHRLEALTDFELSHGEAVSVGVAVDTVYSSLAHGLPEREADRVLRCLLDLGLPVDHPALHAERDRLFEGLEEFRQHLGGRLTLTMLRDVGDPIDVHVVDRELMEAAIRRVGDTRGPQTDAPESPSP